MLFSFSVGKVGLTGLNRLCFLLCESDTSDVWLQCPADFTNRLAEHRLRFRFMDGKPIWEYMVQPKHSGSITGLLPNITLTHWHRRETKKV